jgi:hypothetical protein
MYRFTYRSDADDADLPKGRVYLLVDLQGTSLLRKGLADRFMK